MFLLGGSREEYVLKFIHVIGQNLALYGDRIKISISLAAVMGVGGHTLSPERLGCLLSEPVTACQIFLSLDISLTSPLAVSLLFLFQAFSL